MLKATLNLMEKIVFFVSIMQLSVTFFVKITNHREFILTQIIISEVFFK